MPVKGARRKSLRRPNINKAKPKAMHGAVSTAVRSALKEKSPARYLLARNLNAKQLRERYTVSELRMLRYTCKDLLELEFTPKELMYAGFSLEEVGAGLTELIKKK